MTILAYLVMLGGVANILLAIVAFGWPERSDPRQVVRRWTNLFLGAGFILMAVAFLRTGGGQLSESPLIVPASVLLGAGALSAWAPWKRG